MDKKLKAVDADKDKKAADSRGSNPPEHDGDHVAGDERRKNERRSLERRYGEDRRKESRRSSDREKEAGGGSNQDRNSARFEQILQEKNDEITRLKGEVDSYKDLLQRRQADFENYKKRTVKFQEDQKKYGIKDFALDIILINDDLIRAIDASSQISDSNNESNRSFVEGVTMISRRIEETLEKYGVVEIESLNQAFNPNYHEAVEIEMGGNYSVDTVTKIHQKGFRIDDLVVRSTKVKVAKPVSASIPGDVSNTDDGTGTTNQAGDVKSD